MNLRAVFIMFLLCALVLLAVPPPAAAEDNATQNHTTQKNTARNQQKAQDSDAPIELGEEYVEYARPSGSAPAGESGKRSVTQRVLLYVPNRVVDFLDIFRVDVGAGPSVGGVIRVTKYAQAGMRTMYPLSVRIGLAGRSSPVFVESSNEVGVSPGFIQSKDRKISAGEVGLGLDLGIVGAYAGLCLDEAGDFVAGIVGLDPKDDDF